MADTAAESVQREGEQQPSAAAGKLNGGELVPAKLEKAPITTGPRGFELTTLDDVWRFAKCIAVSGMAPKGMERAESLVVAMQMGAEVGLPPMAAIQNIAVINNRPSLWGDALLGVCRASGLFDEEAFEEIIPDGPAEMLTATCTVRRLPNGKPVTRTFSRADAKQADLAGKGIWKQYPKRMLQMRARAWALRDAFADVLRGMACREEMQEAITVDSKPGPTGLDGLANKIRQDAIAGIKAVASAPLGSVVAVVDAEPVAGAVADMKALAPTPAEAAVDHQPDPEPPADNLSDAAHEIMAEAETATIGRAEEIIKQVGRDATWTTEEGRQIREAAEKRIETRRAQLKGTTEGQSEMFP